MKIMNNWLVRGVSALVLAVAFVVPLVVPARAEAIDYEDYVADTIYIDDENSVAVVEFPVGSTAWFWKHAGDSHWQGHTIGSSYTYIGEPTNDLVVKIFPLGHNVTDDTDELSLDNIPNGSVLTFNFKYADEQDLYCEYTTGINYYVAGEVNPIGVQSWSSGVPEIYSGDLLTWSVTIEKGDIEFTGIRPWLELYCYGNGDEWAQFDLLSFTLEIPISSLYADYLQTGKTNKLLEAVEDRLEEQGKTMEEVLDQQQQTNDKLDEIIDSTVAPVAPEGDDTVNDYGDLEEGIMNDMSSNFSDADGYLTSATEIISKYGTALLAVSHLFGIFWKFPFFAELVMVAFAFGMFGTLLGVGFGAISAHNAKVERANRQKGKGG